MTDYNSALTLVKDIEKQSIARTGKDAKTKYQLMLMFGVIKDAIGYRTAKKPIDISNDGHDFTCPACKEKIHCIEDTWDKFDVCPCCGQVWK